VGSVSNLPIGHDEHVEALIPWYVNGTIAAADRVRVEQHLSECAACRASLELEARIASRVSARSDATGDPQAGWARLASRTGLTASAERPPRAGHSRSLRWVVLAQAAAIAVLAFAVLALVTERTRSDYRTLMQPAAVLEGPVVRVVFADDTSSARIRALLDHVHGTIRSGPTQNKLYTIELSPDGTADAPGPIEAAHWLRAQPEVLFAEAAAESPAR
jgi:anti-sigma factor RsiW